MKLLRSLKERYRYSLILLRQLVITDFKLRYQGSVLGYGWSLLRPMFMFAVLYFVFGVIFKIGGAIPHYPIYLLLGIVLWNFFAEMTNQSLSSVIDRGDLIRKINIPRWLIVVSASISALINLLLNLLVVLVFSFINKVDFMSTSIRLPLYVLEVYLFALGISLLLAALYVKYRDVKYIWELFIQAGFYATPILYPLSLVGNVDLQKLLLLNPLAQAIQGARHSFVTKEALTTGSVHGTIWGSMLPLVIVAVVLLGGIIYFRSRARYFAEDL